MILTSELDTLNGINEAWLRESLQREAHSINEHTDTHMEVYNNRPYHFTIVVDDTFYYMLDITDYTAELTQQVSALQDETLLVAVPDGSIDFEDKLATVVISTIYQTL